MSLFRYRHSLLALITYLTPAIVLASPHAPQGIREESLSRRSNRDHLKCGNAPNIIAGYHVDAADISVPGLNQGPPKATTDKYFPYLWCGANTSTYVFIDPVGNWGYNMDTQVPIYWTGLDGMLDVVNKSIAGGDQQLNQNQMQRIPINLTALAVESGVPISYTHNSNVAFVEVFAQNANHHSMALSVYASALTIMKDFVTTYPLYADTMIYQVSDSNLGTVGDGYMGLVFQGGPQQQCLLSGVLPCAMPSDYPNS